MTENKMVVAQGFTPSKYQAQIFQDIVERSIHAIVVSAVPGAGKTETIRRMIEYIRPECSVLSLAFNSDAAAQLGDKITLMLQEMAQSGRSGPSVESLTIHKLGNATLKKRNMSKKTENFKYNKLIREYLKAKNVYDKNFTDAVKKLVDMARLTLSAIVVEVNTAGDVTNVKINPQEALHTCNRFDIELDPEGEIEDANYDLIPEWDLALETAAAVLKAGIRAAKVEGVVDFTDMIWLPVILGMKPQKYDYVLVDEAQDLSPCQRALVLSARANNGYFVAVGDRNQAIYGFAGASLNSLDEIVEATGAVERPLSICYRCPKSVIDMASAIYPGIEAHEAAHDGIATYTTQDKIFAIIEEIEARATSTDKKPLILSRTTAPLVSYCLELLRSGKRANVRGKDLGATFTALLEKINKFHHENLKRRFSDLPNFVLDYKEKQIAVLTLTSEEENEAKIDSLNDKVDTLIALYTGYMEYFADMAHAGNMKDFINGQMEPAFDGFLTTVKSFFTDKPDAQIILSTGHRSKGLEYEYVIILGYDKIPHPRAKNPEAIRQEMNLKYVMTTRAKKEIYLSVDFVPSMIVDATAEMVEEVAQVEAPVVEAAPVAQIETKAASKRGREATGRVRPKKQFTLDPDTIGYLKHLVESGEAKNDSAALDAIVQALPGFAAWKSAQDDDEDPDPTDGPGGGAPTPEPAADPGLENVRQLTSAVQSFAWQIGTIDDEEDDSASSSTPTSKYTSEELETAVSSLECDFGLSTEKTVRMFFKHKFGQCKNVWTIDYIRAQDGRLYRVDASTGEVIYFDTDPARECSVCGKKGGAKHLKAKYSESHLCNAICKNATGPECTCSCGGLHHGENHMVGSIHYTGVQPSITLFS